jgi:hypothetical protein
MRNFNKPSSREGRSSRAGTVGRGIGVLTLAALAACGSGTPKTSGDTVTASPPVAGSTAPTHSQASGHRLHVEIADRTYGLELWSNNLGSPSDLPPLKLGRKVGVICLAPNDSGMASADPGFYKFKDNGQTVYGISNEFANGDPVGQPGYYTNVDPSVPAC